MSERKVELDTTKTASETPTVEETRDQRKARIAQVFERGVLGDRLHVDLPPNLKGEWVPTKDGIHVARKKALGFWIDEEHAKNHAALHDKGDIGSHVGDVVFMVCTTETKELLDEVKAERFRELHAPNRGKQKEDKDYLGVSDAETKPHSDSKVVRAGAHDIMDALRAVHNEMTNT